MLSLLLTFMLPAKVESWYGPVAVSFEIPFGGSAYDGLENDIRVEFTKEGKTDRRIAYFDGAKWNAVLLAESSGNYGATVFQGQAKVRVLPGTLTLSKNAGASFIRVGEGAARFKTSEGKPFWPVGHNLGWQSANFKPVLVDQLAEMGRAGLNWSRIWSCSWDGKNPYWVDGKKLENPRDMFPEVMERWDKIVAAAEKSGIHFQFVLFHHGLFSSNVNPNWPDHLWNKKNGGFLEKPDDFFTDAEANRRAKNWLRYAVARWGHSPAIMAWELFNEVEWCDGMRNNPTAVAKWHEEMSAYLRSIDPYHHLVTSSSWMELPIWKAADYYQPHGYPPSVRSLVMGTQPKTDKPMFYGEVGLGEGGSRANAGQVIRDSVWSGLMAGHAGAAQFWYWDQMSPTQYAEYRRFTSFTAAHKLTEGRSFIPIKLDIQARKAGAVTFAPGQGWAKTTQFVFNMPEDALSGSLGKLAGFIQGPGKKDMMAEPIRFTFDSANEGRFEMGVSSVAKAGANIVLSLDGIEKVNEKVAGQDRDISLNKTFGFGFTPGKHTITVSNPGPDWYVAASFKIDGIGRAVTGSASKSGNRVLFWLDRNTGDPERFVLSGLPADWKTAKLSELDLDTGRTAQRNLSIATGTLAGQTLEAKSAIWLLEKL